MECVKNRRLLAPDYARVSEKALQKYNVKDGLSNPGKKKGERQGARSKGQGAWGKFHT